ncbi:queuosine precursor transporter [Sphingopyxis yananensis]|uniref:queuosine precursor transporter n=1 Tax=Sphingopyxis yananensis TaxID=2886687 RepID=UPI001D1028E9|nr:queuosine precursor transporter [Sphingopyxis yananensis]MCC2601886.1 queuosine precursor transporter [Sphingopyxis yananensis]
MSSHSQFPNPAEGQSAADQPVAISASAIGQLRYYDFVMAAFVTILLLSNIIGASKPSYIPLPDGSQWAFGAGVLFFPIGYILGDVLTEVYGYARARRVIWTGFAALLFMAFMAWVVVSLPPAAGWPGQESYEFVFGNSWRIVAASMTAFWAGEFANSYVLARMKIWTKGKHLWARTIGSTIVGQGLDSLLFYPLAFYGLAGWPPEQLWQVIVSQWLIKSGWEALLTPFTYWAVHVLKRREGIDVYDEGTNFSPFQAKL